MNVHREKIRSPRLRLAFTLIEMLIASTTAAILVAGLSSSLYIAGKSLDVGTQTRVKPRDANAALASLHRDLQSATQLIELTEHAVTIQVPDRSNNDSPETIRYAWSGIRGEPLTRKYNSDPAVALVKDVKEFSLVPSMRLLQGLIVQPYVLFVSGQAPNGAGKGYATPSRLEQSRIGLMENTWGFRVTVLSQQATQTEIDAALVLHNVIYVSGEISSATIGTKFSSTQIGIVSESLAYAKTLGFYSGSTTASSSSLGVDVLQTSHYITERFTIGDNALFLSNQTIKSVDITLASGVVTLAKSSQSPTDPTFLILEQGDTLAGGAAAPGRRCLLPWGESGFDATSLAASGQIFMRRAIRWGAGSGGNSPIFREVKIQEQGYESVHSIRIEAPDNLARGDLLIAAVSVEKNHAATLNPPPGTGWNEIQIIDDGDKITLGVWWKLATANEPDDYTFTWSTHGEAYGWIMRFTGHHPVNPIHAFAARQGKSKTPRTLSVITTADRCLILRLGAFHMSFTPDLTDGDMASHEMITVGASRPFRSIYDFGHNCGAAVYKNKIQAGNVGTADFMLMFSQSEEYCTLTIAIEPAHLP